MYGTRVDVQFGGHTGPTQSRGEIDRLVAQAVDRADTDECRWQAAQFKGPGRSCIRWYVVGAVAVAEITAPAECVGFAAPYRQSLELAGYGAVVEHRVLQVLKRQRDLPAGAPPQSEACGQCPAGASSADPDPLWVDLQIVGVVHDEAKPVLAVVQCRGIGRFGCQPVFDADADTAQPAAPLDQAGVVHVPVADHHPSAVHPVQDGRLGRGLGES